MKTLLVTGSGGFVGNHLLKELSANGYKVIGVERVRSSASKQRDTLSLDLLVAKDVAKIDFTKIDAVVHLAGLAVVGPSFSKPMDYITTNMGIEVNLFETALAQNAKPKFLIISSSALYDTNDKLPLTEESSVLANSPYAVSKLGQEQVAGYYKTRGFECIIARPFNHIGPGQGLGFLIPDLAQQIVECEKGRQHSINVGNLDSKRDFTDVRDIVRAYRLLIEEGKAGETYNVCSGKAVSGRQILDVLLAASKVRPTIKRDISKTRPSDALTLYGSCTKLQKDTGWAPKISLDETLNDVLAGWRDKA